MKFPKFITRLIVLISIMAALTLTVCVVGPNRGRDDHSPLSSADDQPDVTGNAESPAEPFQERESSQTEERNNKEDTFVSEEETGKEPPAFSGAESLPRIVCWGDSLTESSDQQTAYPDVLGRLCAAQVINYGISSDTSFMVAVRAGYVGIYAKSFTIPAGEEPVRVALRTKSGNRVSLLRYGDSGVNPCYIAGIKGRLSRYGGEYYFTRSKSGDTIAVEDGSRLITAGMAQKSSDDVLVIFTGTNDSPDRNSIYDVIKYQRGIIDLTGSEKYVVIGMTCKRVMPDIERVNEILAEEYGEHFLDVREFMLTYGLEYEGLRATSRDTSDIASGEIPSSLRIDYVHGNKYFYDIIANMLYEKMKYLGYLPEGNAENGSFQQSAGSAGQ